MLNAYGLTETTITSTLFDVREELVSAKPSASVPVGQPIGHAHVLVLDQNLNRVPTGGPGEIYIGGCGVARGYLGQPELTAEFSCQTGTASGPAAGCIAPETRALGRRPAAGGHWAHG